MTFRFHSDSQPVSQKDIDNVLPHLWKGYKEGMDAIFPLISPPEFFNIESCIDFSGTEQEIEELHNFFGSSVYVKHIPTKTPYKKEGTHKPLPDGRQLFGDNPTHYVGKKPSRIKVYRFTQEELHYVRFELSFQRNWLKNKNLIYHTDWNPSIAADYFNQNIFFKAINQDKVQRTIRKKQLPPINQVTWEYLNKYNVLKSKKSRYLIEEDSQESLALKELMCSKFKEIPY